MAANKALKKRARSFAKEHGLSYLTALKAVNEPLHELRDLSRWGESDETVLSSHFRLIGEEGVYSRAYERIPEPDGFLPDDYYIPEDLARPITPFDSPRDFLREMGKRINFLEAQGAEDFWAYRELQRAGLLSEGAPGLEPLFHHYQYQLDSELRVLESEGPRLGIFAVNLSEYLSVYDRLDAIPVTLQQLTALRTGLPAGELSLPRRYDSEFKRSRALTWCPRPGLIASRKDHVFDRRAKRLFLIFSPGATVSTVESKISSLGLDVDSFDVDWPGRKHFEASMYLDGVSFLSAESSGYSPEDGMYLNRSVEKIYQGASYGFLEF